MKIISIMGVPRSGTSWLGQIFNSSPNVAYRYQPLFSYAFKGFLKLDSTHSEIENFHQRILLSDDPFLLQIQNVSGKDEVKFKKNQITHLVWKEVRYLHLIEKLILNSDIKVIGLIRNPLAVMNSWFHAPREFNPDWNKKAELFLAEKKNENRPEEFYGLAKWIEIYEKFNKYRVLYPNRFYMIKYEDLVLDTENQIRVLFNFADLKFESQTSRFINTSYNELNHDPYSVLKNKIDLAEWKNSMEPELVEIINMELNKKNISYE